MSIRNRRFTFLVALLVALTIGAVAAVTFAVVGKQPSGSVILPNGQTITPAGIQLEVNDRPLGIAITPDGTQVAVATASNFQSRALHFIDLSTRSIAQTIGIGNSFVGLAFTADGNTLYVGGGADNDVKIFTRASGGQWTQMPRIVISNAAPSGLSLSPAGDKVYVALNRGHALGIIDVATRAVTRVATGAFPYGALVTKDGRKVYVSNWGGRLPLPGDATDGSNPVVVDPQTGNANNGTISVFDTGTLAVVKTIEVGLHPSAMALSPDGKRLFVANANSDSISVIATAQDAIEATIDVRVKKSDPLGSAPNAIAVSSDGATLYVANAGNNAIAVVEPNRPANPVRGFIPVGWFPAAVALTSDNQLIVGNGYGFGSIAPLPPGATGRSYSDRRGVVSFIAAPASEGELHQHTVQVMKNNETIGGGESPTEVVQDGASPVPPENSSVRSPIEHVIYIIKENRTYDQVFGDIEAGEGDASLAMFGRTVTPNHRALAEQFALLDNFYAAGDQSALGHQWCNEAYANDYVHKYGNARNDFAGTNPMAFAPSGFLWDNARRHGKSVRIYGEFANRTVLTPSNATWTDFYTAWKNGTPGPGIVGASSVKSVQPILSPTFPGYNMGIPEQVRVEAFLEEFRAFEANKNLPHLIVMLLPIDHTHGTAIGFPTPRAMVADNDLALGRIVEAVSRSSYWPKTVIFVTEDDSQNGVDHVDGHRTVGLIVSPYTRRGGIVDSTLYSTVNMFRTIEQILGLPPLNQFDAAAQPMASVFTNKPDTTPYEALPNQIRLDEMNPGPTASLRGLQRELAMASMKMDFTEPDKAPADVLNRAIWHSVKGFDTPYPTLEVGACIPALRKEGSTRLF
jgi:YVTN family beta-propeller protein